MENANRWYFSKEELAQTPSRKSGIDANKELSYRQQAANFIQDMGQRLRVSQLCINTAIVYMHRFYVFHSFAEVHRNSLSVAALFLAAKVEEQPRKLEHVIKVAHVCLHKDTPPLNVKSEAYSEKQLEVVAHENVLLQTLGFVLAIEHPHTYVVKVCQLVKASKDLAQTSYFMATTSLHMTTMCLQYRPTVVACVCIHLACKWASWKIEPCSEGKEWYYYVDKSVTLELLETLTQEFIAILETSPHRFKKKLIAEKEISAHGGRGSFEDYTKHQPYEAKPYETIPVIKKEVSSPGPSTSSNRGPSASFNACPPVDEKPVIKIENDKHPVPPPQHQLLPPPAPSSTLSPAKKNKTVPTHSISIDVYREKKEKERLEQKQLPPEPIVQPPVLNKSQHALNDHERVHLPKEKSVPNSLEPHSHPPKDKVAKNIIKDHQVPSTSVNKVNHYMAKTKSDISQHKDVKSNVSKVLTSAPNEPVVVLERVNVKSEIQDNPRSESQNLMNVVQPFVPDKLSNAYDHKYSNQGDIPHDSKESISPVVPVSSPAIVKSKHQKHKTNSIHNSHNNAQSLSVNISPVKDIKTNGSRETDPMEKKSLVVENNVAVVKTPETVTNKHEKREKHKKHSNSSKDKSLSNHSDNSNQAIKVKIRKDIICVKSDAVKENPKQGIKIKIKPPDESKNKTESLKLVITKDKSGSGSYSTSHKNDRESKKRAHSPNKQDFKSSNETPSKYAKIDVSHNSVKQSKSRHSSSRNLDQTSNDVGRVHLSNDSSAYTVENYGSQAYYGNQYLPFQMTPPPPSGVRVKTNSNPPLPSSLPPQPPPPPPE